MTHLGRTSLRRLVWRSLAPFSVALVCAACTGPKGEPLAMVPSPVPAVESHVGEIKLRPPSNEPFSLADATRVDTLARLKAVPRDPEFNGYYDLVGVAKTRDGLLAHREFDGKTLRKALSQSFKDKEGKHATPLSRDLRAIVHAINKPVLSAPVDIGPNGEACIEGEKALTQVLAAFTRVPQALEGAKDPYVRLDTAYFSIMAARQVAMGAATREHYLAAMTLENVALDQVAKVVKAGGLELADLRDVIAQLQTRSSSPQEYLPVLDIEYLRAAQKRKGANAQAANAGAKPLEAFYLWVRHETLQEPVEASQESASKETLKSPPAPWMSDLSVSRETFTHKSAVELLAALEAFKAMNGHYPAKLEELVPSVLTRVPANLLEDDKAFDYSLKDGKVRLSSNLKQGSPRFW